MKTFIIRNHKDLKPMMIKAWEIVNKTIAGGSVEVVVRRPNKKRDQEKKYHAMIRDIAKQVTPQGHRHSDFAWKVLLSDQFAHDMESAGTPLSNPGELMISMDRQRAINTRPETSKFTVNEASQFIESLYAFGAENKVTWSDPETVAAYQDWSRYN